MTGTMIGGFSSRVPVVVATGGFELKVFHHQIRRGFVDQHGPQVGQSGAELCVVAVLVAHDAEPGGDERMINHLNFHGSPL